MMHQKHLNGHNSAAPANHLIYLADTIASSINLVRLVWQVSDNHSLNIEGA